jgi:hypothetical protein
MPIQVSCWVNDQVHWLADVMQQQETLQLELDDCVDCSYSIKFVFAGKENVENEYVADTAVIINSITVDGIDISPVLARIAKYTHNTNGQTPTVSAEYTDFVGFDGVIEFQFETPVFRWLYRNYCW